MVSGWTEAEEQALVLGVTQFGEGRWIDIILNDAKGSRLLAKKNLGEVEAVWQNLKAKSTTDPSAGSGSTLRQSQQTHNTPQREGQPTPRSPNTNVLVELKNRGSSFELEARRRSVIQDNSLWQLNTPRDRPTPSAKQRRGIPQITSPPRDKQQPGPPPPPPAATTQQPNSNKKNGSLLDHMRSGIRSLATTAAAKEKAVVHHRQSNGNVVTMSRLALSQQGDPRPPAHSTLSPRLAALASPKQVAVPPVPHDHSKPTPSARVRSVLGGGLGKRAFSPHGFMRTAAPSQQTLPTRRATVQPAPSTQRLTPRSAAHHKAEAGVSPRQLAPMLRATPSEARITPRAHAQASRSKSQVNILSARRRGELAASPQRKSVGSKAAPQSRASAAAEPSVRIQNKMGAALPSPPTTPRTPGGAAVVVVVGTAATTPTRTPTTSPRQSRGVASPARSTASSLSITTPPRVTTRHSNTNNHRLSPLQQARQTPRSSLRSKSLVQVKPKQRERAAPHRNSLLNEQHPTTYKSPKPSLKKSVSEVSHDSSASDVSVVRSNRVHLVAPCKAQSNVLPQSSSGAARQNIINSMPQQLRARLERNVGYRNKKV